MRPCSSPARQRGIVLVIVLWMGVLLAIIAAAYATEARTDLTLAAQHKDGVQARAQAQGEVWRGIYALLPKAGATGALASAASAQALAGGRGTVRIVNESGKIDLNAARAELLEGLLRGAGVDEDRTLMLTQTLLDWRDPDAEPREHGAEDAAYRAAGRDYGAKNGPFNSVSELERVLGMDRSTFRAVAPYLTVYSNQPGVDIDAAAAAVRRAVPGLEDTEGSTTVRQLPPGTRQHVAVAPGHTFSVCGRGSAGQARIETCAIVLLRHDGERPYTILAWAERGAGTGAEQSP